MTESPTHARLSFCIPTFGRADKLHKSLKQLASAVAQHPQRDQMEICVSDNASPDDTPAVISKIAQAHPDVVIRRTRQGSNLGFAGNFAAVARMATGDAFIILADDDELRPEALDALTRAINRIGPDAPVALFISLPGGDAIVRRFSWPADETILHGPRELLEKLGIFHASFVSNIMFHRPSALDHLQPDMLKSRYPHTALAFSMLRHSPAIYYHSCLVNVSLPPDSGEQPLLTCVDMARLQSEYVLSDDRCRDLAGWVYRFLLRMLPTAIYLQRTGRCPANDNNPYLDLRLANVRQCYRQSRLWQTLATLIWLMARWTPTGLLAIPLRMFSRHPR